jgi:N-acetylmuramoyl-L-alanine amidase
MFGLNTKWAKLIKQINISKYGKIVPISTVLLLAFIFTGFKTNVTKKININTIVIDAGHGGQDPGCQYFGSKEKDITLKIALELGKKLEAALPDVKIIYTRKTDKFIGLFDRAAIANRNNADLFISIHCNSNPKSEISGSETYVMGLHKATSNLDVAKRENDVITLEENYIERYEGFDPNSPESHIYFSMFQNAYIEQSIKLASIIENHLPKNSSLNSRGVKQAGFLVLWQTKMPSVLVEVGFLSNRKDHEFLSSTEGIQSIAKNITNAILEYKRTLEISGN